MNSGLNARLKVTDKKERISYSNDTSRKMPYNLNENHAYNYISLFNKDGQPDILYNGLLIKGKEYKIKNKQDDVSSEISDHFFHFSFSEDYNDSEDDEVFEKLLKKKPLRYFNVYDISNKCTLCKEGGHLGIVCDSEKVNENFCYRCLVNGHHVENCQNFKCFKCNKFGHKIHECKANEEIKCKRCNMLGHFHDDCLKYPITKGKINSAFCLPFEKRRSYLLDITNIKKLFLYDEQNIEQKNLRNLIKNFTCPKCAGNHSIDRCFKKFSNDPRERNNFRRPNKK
jgi:hypothetical protein